MKPQDGPAADTKGAEQTTQTTTAKPTHRIFVVTGKGKRARWRELGAARPHRDGSGFAITCTAIPLRGRIVMRAITERAPHGQEA